MKKNKEISIRVVQLVKEHGQRGGHGERQVNSQRWRAQKEVLDTVTDGRACRKIGGTVRNWEVEHLENERHDQYWGDTIRNGMTWSEIMGYSHRQKGRHDQKLEGQLEMLGNVRYGGTWTEITRHWTQSEMEDTKKETGGTVKDGGAQSEI